MLFMVKAKFINDFTFAVDADDLAQAKRKANYCINNDIDWSKDGYTRITDIKECTRVDTIGVEIYHGYGHPYGFWDEKE